MLEDVLQSTSDSLFPADLGGRAVTIDSRGGDDDTPMHVMAWRNDLEGVEVLIRSGADVNATGDMGETPLHVHAQNCLRVTDDEPRAALQ